MFQKAIPDGPLRRSEASRQGFSVFKVIIIISLVAIVGFIFLKLSPQSQNLQITFNKPHSPPNPDEPPLKLKSIGINLDYYDPKTNKAGDFKFTRQKLEFNIVGRIYGRSNSL